MTTPDEIVAFWRDAGPAKWFNKDAAFDGEIARRFGEAHHAAARGELDDWEETAEGSLALLLLLDQFPRNLFRGSAHQFATDPFARRVADRAVAARREAALEPALRRFFHLPFTHSETAVDQDRSVALAAGDPDELKWARKHQEVILRFGRFPHRNAALARENTAEEQAYLDAGGGF